MFPVVIRTPLQSRAGIATAVAPCIPPPPVGRRLPQYGKKGRIPSAPHLPYPAQGTHQSHPSNTRYNQTYVKFTAHILHLSKPQPAEDETGAIKPTLTHNRMTPAMRVMPCCQGSLLFQGCKHHDIPEGISQTPAEFRLRTYRHFPGIL